VTVFFLIAQSSVNVPCYFAKHEGFCKSLLLERADETVMNNE
jgi:hypothetical protein